MSKLVVCAVQMVSGKDVELNLAIAQRLVNEAADLGAELIVLPENFAVLDSGNLYYWGEQEREVRIFTKFLSELSKARGIYLVAGSIPMRTTRDAVPLTDQRVRSACLVYDPNGDLISRYDKIHLFDVKVADAQRQYQESAVIAPGDSLMDLRLPKAHLGLSVCYDLRFPELYSALAQRGCEIISVPSAFTYTTGQAHWEVLLRARAIECQAFIVAPNQGGQHSEKRRTWGHSMIVDPWGTVLALVEEEGAGLAVATIDLGQVQELRNQMPLREHRRNFS